VTPADKIFADNVLKYASCVRVLKSMRGTYQIVGLSS